MLISLSLCSFVLSFLEGDRPVLLIHLEGVLMAYISVSSFVRRKQPSPEHMPRRESVAKLEALTNGKWSGPSHTPQHQNFGMPFPKSPDSDDDEEYLTDTLDRRWAIFVSLKSVEF